MILLYIATKECLKFKNSIFRHNLFMYGYLCRRSNPNTLKAAVEETLSFLKISVKPVLIGGPKLRVARASKAFVEFAKASGFAVAIMPSAKGQVPESLPNFIGTYWGAVSSPFCLEIVESADCYIFVGPIFNDYSSVGYSLLLKKSNMIVLDPNKVNIGAYAEYGCVRMKDFLDALTKQVVVNTNAIDNYRRLFVPVGEVPTSNSGDELRVNTLFGHIQV